MTSKAHLPPIICSSCLSFIGHKYIEYKTLTDNGYSKLDTLESLSIANYCCRMLIENAIVVSTNYGDKYEKEKPYKDDKPDDDGECITMKGVHRYFDTLTKKYENGSNKAIREKISLRESLATRREYRTPIEKVMDLDLIYEEVLVLDVGLNKPIKKINKVYIASVE